MTGGEPSRAAPLRRLARPRRALRPHRRVPLRAARRVGDEPFDFDGRYYHVEGATTTKPFERHPTLYFGGASEAAERVAAKHVDVYLTWGEPPAMVAPRLARMRELAAEQGRTLRFGIRLHVITRDRAEDAWAGDGAVPRRARPRRRRRGAGGVRPERVGRSAADDRAARRLTRRPGDRPEPVGRLRPGARRRRHDARRQPRGGRRADRGVPRPRLRRVRPLRPPAPRGGLLVRRGRHADPAPARPASATASPAAPRAARRTSRWRRALDAPPPATRRRRIGVACPRSLRRLLGPALLLGAWVVLVPLRRDQRDGVRLARQGVGRVRRPGVHRRSCSTTCGSRCSAC